MSEAQDKYIADLEKEIRARDEMLALILNETGPVEIKRNARTEIPTDAQIAVDIDAEAEAVIISLVVPDA